MSNYSLLKKVIGFGALLLIGVSGRNEVIGKVQQSHNQSRVFSSEAELIRDAWGTIKRCLKHDQIGSPYIISCAYRMSGSTYKAAGCSQIQTTLKVYYVDYHKEPSCFEKTFIDDDGVKPDKIIEIVYKPTDKNHLSVIEKDPSALYRKLATREITLPSLVLA